MEAESGSSTFRKYVLGAVVVLFVVLVVASAWVWSRLGIGARTNVLEAHGIATVSVMDFSQPFTLDPLPPGWHHRKFLTRAPMELALVEKAGMPAIRCRTADSASMLFRYVDIELARYPWLEWSWFVEQGIRSEVDERTTAGDDHPARLFLTFRTAQDERRSMEIVWGNTRLRAGDWKYIGDFPHYVANGGDQQLLGKWHDESVDLRALYGEIWGDRAPARLTEIALFCDSDETDGATTAYFGYVRLRQVTPGAC